MDPRPDGGEGEIGLAERESTTMVGFAICELTNDATQLIIPFFWHFYEYVRGSGYKIPRMIAALQEKWYLVV